MRSLILNHTCLVNWSHCRVEPSGPGHKRPKGCSNFFKFCFLGQWFSNFSGHSPREVTKSAHAWNIALKFLIRQNPSEIGPRNSCDYFPLPHPKQTSLINYRTLFNLVMTTESFSTQHPIQVLTIDGGMKSTSHFLPKPQSRSGFPRVKESHSLHKTLYYWCLKEML